MNLFFLDKDHAKAASYYFDTHVIKIILEAALMLSAAVWRVLPDQAAQWSIQYKQDKESGKELQSKTPIYRPTHKNHPMTLFVGSSLANFRYAADHALALAEEYRYRFKKTHKSERIIRHLLKHHPPSEAFPSQEPAPTMPPQAMPEEYRVPGDTVQAYRRYYMGAKRHLASWRRRGKPSWYDVDDALLMAAARDAGRRQIYLDGDDPVDTKAVSRSVSRKSKIKPETEFTLKEPKPEGVPYRPAKKARAAKASALSALRAFSSGHHEHFG
eukprot:gnl/Dysnectes_brevis/9722_a18375_195.p1 GENE.gnl/Dysnectes_brevis/9722_a18375_195~~gnl/Dysnectes_brevis/9722_a18375_195.p1  ORF type:complete len:271 (+),score=54.64 gnl/Dysnectes_brevis/9722_a18375_195:46-858(+)